MKNEITKIQPLKYVVSNDIPDRQGLTWHVYAILKDTPSDQAPRKLQSLILNFYDEDKRYHFVNVPQSYPTGFDFGGSLLMPTTYQRNDCVDGKYVDINISAANVEEACDFFFERYGIAYEFGNP